MDVQSADLAQVPYLDVKDLHGRTVVLMPLWDGSGWHIWIPRPTGLLKMRPRDAAHADYVAVSAAQESDLWIPFVDLMWQRASWPDICPLIRALGDDFHNLATSVAKLRHFYDTRKVLGIRAASFAATEIEYLLALTRGTFDLLQETIAKIWSNHIRLLDAAAEKRRRSRKLPDTFSRMVLHEKRKIKTHDELALEYGIPRALAEAYTAAAPFFSKLRDLRDRVIHQGDGVQTIFVTERGLCFSANGPAARLYEGWAEVHKYNENLVSMLPWLAHIVLHTINTCSTLMQSFAAQIELPPELAPGYRVFIRGENSEAIIDLLRADRGETVWWDSAEEEMETPRANDGT
jgi:hypothetical protein